MAQGQYKNGVQINLVYQAAGLLSNAVPIGTVYDEGSAVHSAETTALTSALAAGELADPADGRYLGHFTPDAEGMWTVVIKDKNGSGEVTKHYDVAGHDLDSIGDAQISLESGIKSDALLQQSAIVSSVKSDALLQQSAINSSVKSDALVKQSAVNDAVRSQVLLMISAISDVESAVDLIGSVASVS